MLRFRYLAGALSVAARTGGAATELDESPIAGGSNSPGIDGDPGSGPAVGGSGAGRDSGSSDGSAAGGSAGASTGGDTTGGEGPDAGGSGSTDIDDDAPVATIFEHCNYGGWSVSLAVGDYTTDDLLALGAADDATSSVSVSAGYEVILFDGDNFSGRATTLTADTMCTVERSFNDRASSIRVQRATDHGGTGGSGNGDASGGSGGAGEMGVTACQPAFEAVCKPNIRFDNPFGADGGGKLFNELFPEIEAEMQDVACTVCSMLFRSPDEIPQGRRHTTINLNIKNIDPPAHAFGNTIEMDIDHINR